MEGDRLKVQERTIDIRSLFCSQTIDTHPNAQDEKLLGPPPRLRRTSCEWVAECLVPNVFLQCIRSDVNE